MDTPATQPPPVRSVELNLNSDAWAAVRRLYGDGYPVSVLSRTFCVSVWSICRRVEAWRREGR